jgi:basic amino acid/polyamine antiporter, APA family
MSTGSECAQKSDRGSELWPSGRTAPGEATVIGRAVPGKRRLGLPSAGALIVGNMIGAGVFTTSGYALADLGRPEVVLLAWLVGGALALCGALSYGALAHRIPESGGEYTYLTRIVHPLAGFLAGWVSLLAGFTAPIAAGALALQAYLADAFEIGLRPEWLGTLAILMAALMHGSRLREGVVLQNLAVGLKLVLIAALVGAGVAWLPSGGVPSRELASDVDFGAFAVTLVWISSAYSGWNAAVYVAGEIRDPERNVRRSLWLATAAVTVIYVSLNWVFLYSAPTAVLAGRPDVAAAAAEALGGTGLRRSVSALVALALFTSISTMVMAGPRVYARMAEDGLFPRFFGKGDDVPRAAIALQAALAIGVVWVSGLRALLSYIGFTLGLSAAATVAAVFVLRRREGAVRLPVPGYPWVPGVFVLVTLGTSGFMAAQEPRQAFLGLLTLVLGAALHWLIKKRGRHARR